MLAIVVGVSKLGFVMTSTTVPVLKSAARSMTTISFSRLRTTYSVLPCRSMPSPIVSDAPPTSIARANPVAGSTS